jgi:hypothetical protein
VATLRLTAVVVEVPFAVAVTVTWVALETVPAVTENVAVVVPIAAVTEAGTVRAGLLPARVMDKPLATALLNVIVQVEVSPDLNVAGLQFSDVGTARARSVSEELTETPFSVTVMVAVVSAVTAEAVAVKVAVDTPAATLTEIGTLSEALLANKLTIDPPAGAGSVKVTVQVAEPGPVIEDGLQVRLLT